MSYLRLNRLAKMHNVGICLIQRFKVECQWLVDELQVQIELYIEVSSLIVKHSSSSKMLLQGMCSLLGWKSWEGHSCCFCNCNCCSWHPCRGKRQIHRSAIRIIRRLSNLFEETFSMHCSCSRNCCYNNCCVLFVGSSCLWLVSTKKQPSRLSNVEAIV